MLLLLYITLANTIIGLLSIVGSILLFVNDRVAKKFIFGLLGLSTGTLLGGALLHLLPESLEVLSVNKTFMLVLMSFVIFLLIEKIFHWHHCHDGECDTHSLGYMNLVGDGVHNFIDGLSLAAVFAVDVRLGIVASVAIAVHEVPQEIGDFAVLLYSGFSKKSAILFNFGVSLLAVLGGIVGFFVLGVYDGFVAYLLPFAAGGFIYIAMSDLIPEIKNETNGSKSILAFALFIIGVSLMYVMTFF